MNLDDLRDYVRENLASFLAIVVIGVIIAGYLLFIFTSILPRWTVRRALLAQVDAARSGLDAQQSEVTSPQVLQTQLSEARAQLAGAANSFLSESQAADILNRLYQYATESGVEIANLQTQATGPDAALGADGVYEVQVFSLQVEGELPQLMDFIGRIQEAAVPAVVIDNVNINAGEGVEQPDTLTMNLSLYTSPLSTGDVIADSPSLAIPTPPFFPPSTPLPLTPSPAVPDTSTLAQQLDAPWAAGNWPEVIRLIEQILAINPNDEEMRQKLYSAYVNYGHQLASQQRHEEARAAFAQALVIQPDGADALAGIQVLDGSTPTPTPAMTIYLVRRGDTLYSLAQRFGTTVEAIRQANSLATNQIYAGQQLIIPR